MRYLFMTFALFFSYGVSAQTQDVDALKAGAIASIDGRNGELVAMSEDIWSYAEIAFEEVQSSRRLADYAEQQGFVVQRGIAGMPTAFLASFGEGEPVIAILGEYDALPRLSQAAQPARQAITEGGHGQGCGHNLFGVAGLGAATAIKELIEADELEGTIRFYGTPAEESWGGKIYMARDGVFDDVDISLSWHPGFVTKIKMAGSMAIIDTLVEFRGVSAHAAMDPWNGRSALDGLELFTHALNLWREHVEPTARIHYTYIDGGGAPNVVPETASASVWIRDYEMPTVLTKYERMIEMADGAAKAANVEAKVTMNSANYNMMHNAELAKLVHANMMALPTIAYDDDEQAFARELQTAMGHPAAGMDAAVVPLNFDETYIDSGSTDTGDVSWVIPAIEFTMTTAPKDIPWHSWGVVASSGMSIGQKGMMQASKVIAMTAIDLFSSPEAIAAAKAQHAQDVGDLVYKAYVPDGPPPIPQTSGD